MQWYEIQWWQLWIMQQRSPQAPLKTQCCLPYQSAMIQILWHPSIPLTPYWFAVYSEWRGKNTFISKLAPRTNTYLQRRVTEESCELHRGRFIRNMCPRRQSKYAKQKNKENVSNTSGYVKCKTNTLFQNHIFEKHHQISKVKTKFS